MRRPSRRGWLVLFLGASAVLAGWVFLEWLPLWRQALAFRPDALAPAGGSARVEARRVRPGLWPSVRLQGLVLTASPLTLEAPTATVRFSRGWDRTAQRPSLEIPDARITLEERAPLSRLLEAPPHLPVPLRIGWGRLQWGSGAERSSIRLEGLSASAAGPWRFRLRGETTEWTVVARSEADRTLRIRLEAVGDGWNAGLKVEVRPGLQGPTVAGAWDARGGTWTARGALRGGLSRNPDDPWMQARMEEADVELPGLGEVTDVAGSMVLGPEGLAVEGLAGQTARGRIRIEGRVQSSPPRFVGGVAIDGVDLPQPWARLSALVPDRAPGWTGRLQIRLGSLNLSPDLVARNASASIQVSPQGVAWRDLECDLAGGSLKGDFRAHLGDTGTSWVAALEAHGVQLEALTRLLEGSFSGKGYVGGLQYRGALVPGSLTGRGEFEIAHGGLAKLSLPGEISTVGGIENWAHTGDEGTEFSSLDGAFALEGSDLVWKDLALQASGYGVEAEGTEHLPQGAIRLRAEGIVSPALAQLLQATHLNGWKDSDGALHIPMLMTGRWTDLAFELDRLALASQLQAASRQQVLDDLNQLLARRFGGEDRRPASMGEWMQQRIEEFLRETP